MHPFQSRFRPCVEMLEDRWCPSCTVTESGGILTITGDAGANSIQITDNGSNDPGAISVTCDGAAAVASTAAISEIRIASAQGNDTVSYTLSADLAMNVARTVNADLGEQADSFSAVLNGDLLETSHLTLNVNGGNQNDTIRIDASNDVDVRAGAALDINLQGGNGQDTLRTDYDGELDGTLSYAANGANGKDDIAATFNFAQDSSGTFNGSMQGGNAKDQLVFVVTDADEPDNDGDGDPSNDQVSPDITATMDGGNGTDSGTHTDNVTTNSIEENLII